MKRGIKIIMVSIIVPLSVAMLFSPVMAQFPGTGNIWQIPAFQSQPLQVPTVSLAKGDILIDNFEYWDSPYNHGWRQSVPAYPVYGFGMGYTTIFNTVLDLREGSRVLDAYRPSSVFLLGTPYEKHAILYKLFTPPSQSSTEAISYIDLEKYPVLNFKFRAPIGIEPWDIFEFDIIGFTNADHDIIVQIRPLQQQHVSREHFYHSEVVRLVDSAHNPAIIIQVDMGRNALDGSWHTIWLNLPEIVQAAVDDYDAIGNAEKGDWYFSKADKILITGQMFRLDDIIFRIEDYSKKEKIDFYEIGPKFSQIFEPYRHLFSTAYRTGGAISSFEDLPLQQKFIIDPNQIREAWVADLLSLDPNYHVIDPNHALYDPNYTNRWIQVDPNFGKPDPVAGIFLRDDFFIDSTLPVFADQNFRIGGTMAAELRNHGTLGWNMTVNGCGKDAIQAFFIKPLPINPYDGMPTYYLNKYASFEAIKTFGKAHYGPAMTFTLESALWNSGVVLWPNIAYMDYTPQYFEDLIVTIEVTNGVQTETLPFPISVVNYPVENHAPVLQPKVCSQIFYVGQEGECMMLFLDPDCFIFSLAQSQGREPATSHVPGWPYNEVSPFSPPQNIRTDQDQLIYRMTINGLPNYQYGPWIEDIMDPKSGLGGFIPKAEGIVRSVITATDQFGYTGYGSRTIYFVNPGTWLNHPPIITKAPSKPQVAKAGEEIVVTDIKLEEPDGDQIYASCNIGSIGVIAGGSYTGKDFIWTFKTNFPGIYNVEIIFYDIRGAYDIMKIMLYVVPWWSY